MANISQSTKVDIMSPVRLIEHRSLFGKVLSRFSLRKLSYESNNNNGRLVRIVLKPQNKSQFHKVHTVQAVHIMVTVSLDKYRSLLTSFLTVSLLK